MTGFRNDFVYFKSRKLTAFSWFCTLCHLDLYFLGIYKIFGSYTKSSTSHLLCFAATRNTIYCSVETLFVLTTFTGIASSTQLIHRQTHCLMSFLAQSTETHRTCYEVLYDAFYWLYLLDVDRVLLIFKEVAEEDRTFLFIHQTGVFLEEGVIALVCSQLKGCDSFRIPSMLDTILAPMELAESRQQSFSIALSLCKRVHSLIV